MTSPTAPEDCTANGTTRHLSIDLRQVTDSRWITGRTGKTLCGKRAYDELAARQNFGEPVVLADLPERRKCAHSARILATTAALANAGAARKDGKL